MKFSLQLNVPPEDGSSWLPRHADTLSGATFKTTAILKLKSKREKCGLNWDYLPLALIPEMIE
jgi:hypothetical protein